jgi:hypothetical protein
MVVMVVMPSSVEVCPVDAYPPRTQGFIAGHTSRQNGTHLVVSSPAKPLLDLIRE